MKSMLLVLLLLAASTVCGIAVAYASTGESSSAPSGSIFGNLFEYTFEVSGSQIFTNDTIKKDIVNNYRQSEYNITSLEYDLMGHHINASDVTIGVDPARVDDAKTRLELDIYAEQADVTGTLDRSYERIDLQSVYWIYDKTADSMTVYVPMDVALSVIR